MKIEENISYEELETEGYYKWCEEKYWEYKDLVDKLYLEIHELEDNIKMLLTLLREERKNNGRDDNELPFEK